VVETLADEFDVMAVALAAVKLAHEATGAAADDEEIPEYVPRAERPRGHDRADRPPKGRGPGVGAGERGKRAGGAGTLRIYVGAGRSAGIRPQDLVGAIAGESRLSGRDIGAIEIADRFSLVEVPEDAVDEVIAALKGTTLKGRRPTVRRERFEAR
jgi:ATP-dependent RNA helicase DeaD